MFFLTRENLSAILLLGFFTFSGQVIMAKQLMGILFCTQDYNWRILSEYKSNSIKYDKPTIGNNFKLKLNAYRIILGIYGQPFWNQQ